MKKTEFALKWIVEILNKNNIPFQITGGFAANLHGTKRELADIDIEISEKSFDIIFPFVKDFVIYGPQNYKDENWDLMLMTLVYENQEIDISSTSCRYFNKTVLLWENSTVDLSKAVMKEVYGIYVPIIQITDLISYKSKIARDVDISDVKELSQLINI